MARIIDGFWLPAEIRDGLINSDTEFVSTSFAYGKECSPDHPEAITARWPVLRQDDWDKLVSMLQAGRQSMPMGLAFWERLGSALQKSGQRFNDANDHLRSDVLKTIPGYTGYSQAMIQLTLKALDFISLDQMTAAYSLPQGHLLNSDWQTMGDLPGRLIFNPTNLWDGLIGKIHGLGANLQVNNPLAPEFVLGYGAGNVPGTALLITLLALSTTLTENPPPTILVRNSRREPIFSPLVLSAIEAVDPELLAGVAVLVWDYMDQDLQGLLLSQSDLVIAAASDETINSIATHVSKVNHKRDKRSAIRFHQHGHKVSFSVIDREFLSKGLTDNVSQTPMINILALLAGLDSIYWDQYGCLSSRIHFVEQGGDGDYTPQEYAEALTAQLRILSNALPRGSTPRRLLKDNFDRYKLLETTNQVTVVSEYEDDFLVVVDTRQLDPMAFYATVNSCMGRVVIVRPVADLMEVPYLYLRMLPPANLQSLSIAAGPANGSGELSQRTLDFARACARRGVTAIRSLGRGAFPQLAYSWDGLIPLDLAFARRAGHFTTIEFEDAFKQIIDTYHNFLAQAENLALMDE